MKTFISLLLIGAMGLSAQAEIINGKPSLDRAELENPSIHCLVRYHGMTSIKKHYPDSPLDREVRTFSLYLETGKAGEHGTTQPLKILPESQFSGYLKLTPFEFAESDFGLKYKVTDSGGAFIKRDAQDANGELTMTIEDSETGELVGTADFPIEMFFTGGYSIPQVTVGLPARVIEKQQKTLTWDKDLLTQVRFQCN